MGVEEDHQSHKIEEACLRKVTKTPGDFGYGAHTPTCTQVPGCSKGCGQESQRGLCPWLLPTAARKNWAWEQRSDTLQAPQKPECRKLKNEKRNRCKLQNEQISTCRSSETKLRDRWLSAIQDNCTHGRTVSILCPANTGNLSENCNPSSLSIWKKMTGFYHCKPLHSWTKIYASKARTSKTWALFNLQLPIRRVNRKHLPAHSLWYDLKYVHFVARMWQPHHVTPDHSTKTMFHLWLQCCCPAITATETQNSWCTCLRYGHK